MFGYFRDHFFADLKANISPLVGIYLVLHGAMVCESYLDVEGQLLEEINIVLAREGCQFL